MNASVSETPEPVVALPDIHAIRAAAARIAGHARVTPVMRSDALDALTGARLHFKCEHLQRGGAFKFRGACNAVWSLREDEVERGVVTHSSGNHGLALALASATRGMQAHIVIPEGAVRSKVEAIEAVGARIHRCAPTQAARDAMAARIRVQTGALLVHPYADTRVIAGQGTLALELLGNTPLLDVLLTPVGGGGLAAGVAIAAHALVPGMAMVAAEPAGADDAARSLAAGRRITDVVPDTCCDGLRATIGAPNLEALQRHRTQVLIVDDAQTIKAMRLLWQHLKQVVEPSSATVLAAVIAYPQVFAGRRIGVVLTGGNIDMDALSWGHAARD
ncbi:pyridoxal-phosphate dependent enzyme [Oleiagrimonas sp.]|jgi:threonine dehydratase|uniref:pyridoxal-phosphate dependent enzyme n=1 Tax=Oleiagrimonas sp. TaxID=2010330 RepID=UPI0026076E4E|nr:pyridoxal-phosphate dependent enzyme [Oleiagrimonas sp.]MDA3915134.1 pyridoxal-phosphate dependent enzyme [Oleiagrimonas sp.]